MIFKGNIKAKDENNNVLKSDEANYSKNEDLLNSIGFTSINLQSKIIYLRVIM